MRSVSIVFLAALIGCKTADDSDAVDTDVETDTDTDTDTDSDTDTDTDTDTDVAPPEARDEVVTLSEAGPDVFYGVAFAPEGGFYAAGYIADTVDSTADRAFLLAKFTRDGDPDTTFGDGGVVRFNVAQGGTNGEAVRGIAVQSTGNVVVAGAIEHDVTATGTAASDRDIALVRFTPTGSLDTTFGEGGIVVLDLNTGVETTDGSGTSTWNGADALYSLAVTDDDRLVLHGATRAADDGETIRVDTDFALVRLEADGDYDDTFGVNGVFTLDIEQANASARHATVLADGSILAGGYAKTPSFGTTQPVAYKVTPSGGLDESFADEGVFHREILADSAEIYAIAPMGDGFVTAGYGRNSSTVSLDWLSLRLDANGDLVSSWGGDGSVEIDHAGFNDNARHIIALPDGKAMIVGGAGVADGVTDAVYGIIGTDGALGDSAVIHDFGGISDMYWGAAVSPDESFVVVAGVAGAGSGATAELNDDAIFSIVPL